MKRIVMLSALLLGTSAWAQEPIETNGPGLQTKAWLEMQTSGRAASPYIQSDTLATREKSASRWSKTYEFPIKESFYGDGFKPGE